MILQSKSLILRPLILADVRQIACLANNKKIWDNLRNYMPFPYQETDAEAFVKMVELESPHLTFGIAFEQELCGVIGLVAQTDVYTHSAEIGYWLGEPFWGKGIASEAVSLITAYGLNTLCLNRIYAGIFEYNIGSMRVLEKNGYVNEAILEKAIFKNGAFWNEYRYAVLK